MTRAAFKMAEEESRIRQCVRDELELNLAQRTRNLICSAAVSTARDLDQNLGGGSPINRSFIPASRSTSVRTSSTSLSTNSTGDGSSGGAKRTYSTPGHTWRFKKNKAAKIQSIPKTVWLSDKPHEKSGDRQ